MDAVRFGRALGFGARQAAKTLVSAADAATAKNPSAGSGSAGAKVSPAPSSPAPSVANRPVALTPVSAAAAIRTQPLPRAGSGTAAKAAAQTVVKGRAARLALKRGGKRFGEAAWEPVVRLSGVVWLEISGVFFGIFALFAGAAVWRMRGDWHLGRSGQQRLAGAAVMLAVFGYFCISNFVRARRRERGR